MIVPPDLDTGHLGQLGIFKKRRKKKKPAVAPQPEEIDLPDAPPYVRPEVPPPQLPPGATFLVDDQGVPLVDDAGELVVVDEEGQRIDPALLAPVSDEEEFPWKYVAIGGGALIVVITVILLLKR